MTSGRQWRVSTSDRPQDAPRPHQRCDPEQARSPSKHGPQTTRDHGGLIMRKLIATVFNYSLDGLLADEGTEFWKFCFDLPENREPDDPAHLDFLQSAYAHIMGRTAYEGIAGAMTTAADHPFADILNAGRKVVFLPVPEDGRLGQHHHRRW